MSKTGWALRLAPWVAILCGLTLVLAIIASSTFSRADDGQRATDLVRAELTRQGLARHRADYELAKNGVQQFYDEALPAFAMQLGITPQAFGQIVEARYPAVGKLADPSVRAQSFTLADSIVTNLERHQHDFEEADAIPVSWLPMTVGPWVGVVVGVALDADRCLGVDPTNAPSVGADRCARIVVDRGPADHPIPPKGRCG